MSILTVDKLNKKYPGFALQDISFSLTEGAITGFIGRNGSGKTVLFKILCGLTRPTKGIVQIDGHEAGQRNGNSALARRDHQCAGLYAAYERLA